MKKTKPEVLTCVTTKDNNNLETYDIPYVEKNSFSIRDGVLYVKYESDKLVEVPGRYNIDDFGKNDYYISAEKTVFHCSDGVTQYLVYSDDMGESWQTTQIATNYYIRSIQFINKDIGYMLEFDDSAMGTAYGKLLKTIDGGKSWDAIFFGIGDGAYKSFSSGSTISFSNEMEGVLTMPSKNGETTDIYVTKDGGITFSKNP